MSILLRFAVLVLFAASLAMGGGASASNGVRSDGTDRAAAASQAAHDKGGHHMIGMACDQAAPHCGAVALPSGVWPEPSRTLCPLRQPLAPLALMDLRTPETDVPPPRS